MLALRAAALALVLATGGCMAMPRGGMGVDDNRVMLNFQSLVEIGTLAADADVGAYLDRLARKAEADGGAHGVTYRVNMMPSRLMRVLRIRNNREMALYYTVVDVPLGATRRLALQPIVGWQESLGGARVEPVAVQDGASVLDDVKADFEQLAADL